MPMQKFKKPSDIGYAIDGIKHGAKARRKVWPEGVFIYLVKPSIIPSDNLRNDAKRVLADTQPEDGIFKITAHIDMRAADGSIIIGWAITTNDAIADDWELTI